MMGRGDGRGVRCRAGRCDKMQQIATLKKMLGGLSAEKRLEKQWFRKGRPWSCNRASCRLRGRRSRNGTQQRKKATPLSERGPWFSHPPRGLADQQGGLGQLGQLLLDRRQHGLADHHLVGDRL